jgi:chromosomal replication initiator protein
MRERAFIEIFEMRSVNVQSISRIVSRYYGITRERLKSRQRTIPVVRPRQIVMYLAKEHTKLSLPQIGTQLAGLDHTTVLHGVRRIRELMETDAQLAAEVENFERDLGCHRA